MTTTRPSAAARAVGLAAALAFASAFASGGSRAAVAAEGQARLNPVVELLAQKQAIFGLYAPSNRLAGAAGTGQASPPRTPDQLAREALDQRASDYIFDGSMERGLDAALPAFASFASALVQAGSLRRSPAPRLSHPLIVKAPKLAADAAAVATDVSRQLNLGVSGLVFVEVESAEELRLGIQAMRFSTKGGTRREDVGTAPAFWGLRESEYRKRADVWPLAPEGELLAWAIVESTQGLTRVREIAAVPGLSALFPGAGTLRRLFTTTNPAGERSFDSAGWEAAVQQVLAACKEFGVPCGYPASAGDIEARMDQGFSVFVIGWGENGWKAVEIGRRKAFRAPMNQ